MSKTVFVNLILFFGLVSSAFAVEVYINGKPYRGEKLRLQQFLVTSDVINDSHLITGKIPPHFIIFSYMLEVQSAMF